MLNSFDTDLFTAYLTGHYGATATRYDCRWDAENRLVYIVPDPLAPADWDLKDEFAYDYLGRRIEAVVSYWDPEQTPQQWTVYSRNRFVWSGWPLTRPAPPRGADRAAVPGLRLDGGVKGWLLLVELQDYGTPSEPNFQPVRKYTWGLDLTAQNGQVNSLEGAGGILDSASHRQGQVGGLLAVYDLNDTPGAEQTGDDLKYVYTYDGNGNVVQVLHWTTGAMKACYQYDPYGRVLNPTGPYVSRNPFRFSTKYWDDWFGLGYWGYRWYSPVLGRWISRDPIGEIGGSNLLRYCANAPASLTDALGLAVDPDYSDGRHKSACCEYHAQTVSGAAPDRYKFLKTAHCKADARSPEACCACDCACNGMKLTSAIWGPCCTCTMEVRKNAGAWGHRIVKLECPASQWGPGFSWWVHRMPKKIVVPTGATIEYSRCPIDPAPQWFPEVLDSKEITCKEGQALHATLKAAYPDETPDWDWILIHRDCHSFAYFWYSIPGWVERCPQ